MMRNSMISLLAKISNLSCAHLESIILTFAFKVEFEYILVNKILFIQIHIYIYLNVSMETTTVEAFKIIFPRYSDITEETPQKRNEELGTFVRDELPQKIQMVSKLEKTFLSFLNQYSMLILKRPDLSNLIHGLVSRASEKNDKIFRNIEIEMKKMDKSGLQELLLSFNMPEIRTMFKAKLQQMLDLINQKYINTHNISRENQEQTVISIFTLLEVYFFTKSDFSTLASRIRVNEAVVLESINTNQQIPDIWSLFSLDQNFTNYIKEIVHKRCRPTINKRDFIANKIKEILREKQNPVGPNFNILADCIIEKQAYRMSKHLFSSLYQILRGIDQKQLLTAEEEQCKQIIQQAEALRRQFNVLKNNGYYIDMAKGTFIEVYKHEIHKLENLYYLSNLQKYLQDVSQFLEKLMILQERVIENRKAYISKIGGQIQNKIDILTETFKNKCSERIFLQDIIQIQFQNLQNCLFGLVDEPAQRKPSKPMDDDYRRQRMEAAQERQRKLQAEKKEREQKLQMDLQKRKEEEERRRKQQKIRMEERKAKQKEEYQRQKRQREEKQKQRKEELKRKEEIRRQEEEEKKQKRLEEMKQKEEERMKREQEIREKKQKEMKQLKQRDEKRKQEEKMKKQEQMRLQKERIEEEKRKRQQKVKQQELRRKEQEERLKKKKEEEQRLRKQKQEEEKAKKERMEEERKQKQKEEQQKKKRLQQQKEEELRKKKEKQEEEKKKKQKEEEERLKKKKEEEERKKKEKEEEELRLKKKKEEEDRKKKEAEQKKKREDEQRKKRQADQKKRKEEEEKKRKEEEEKKRQEEQARKKREAQQKKKQEQERKKKQEQDRKQKERLKKAEEQRKKKQEQEKKQKEKEEKQRKQRLKKEEEQRKLKEKQQEEARFLLEEAEKKAQLKKPAKGGKSSGIDYNFDDILDEDDDIQHPGNIPNQKKDNADDQYVLDYDDDFDDYSPEKDDQQGLEGEQQGDEVIDTKQLIEYDNFKALNDYLKGTSFARKNKPNLELYNNHEQYVYIFEEFIQNGKLFIFDAGISKAISKYAEEIQDQSTPESDLMVTEETIMQGLISSYQKQIGSQQLDPRTCYIFPFSFPNKLNILFIEVFLIFSENPPASKMTIIFKQPLNSDDQQNMEYFQALIHALRQVLSIEYEPIIQDYTINEQSKMVLQTFDKELPNILTLFAMHYEHNFEMKIKIDQYTTERFFYATHVLQPLYKAINEEPEQLDEFFGGLAEKYSQQNSENIQMTTIEVEVTNPQYQQQLAIGCHQIKEHFLSQKIETILTLIVAYVPTEESGMQDEQPTGQKLTVYFQLSKKPGKPTLNYYIVTKDQQHQQYISQKLIDCIFSDIDSKFETTVYTDYTRHNALQQYSDWTIAVWPQMIKKRKMTPINAFRALVLSMAPYYVAFKKMD